MKIIVLLILISICNSLNAQEKKSFFETNYKSGISLGYPMLMGFYSSLPIYDVNPDDEYDKGFFISNTFGVNLWKLGLEWGVKPTSYTLAHGGGSDFVFMLGFQRIFNNAAIDSKYGNYFGGEITTYFFLFTFKIGTYVSIADDSRRGDYLSSFIVSFGY